MDRIFIKDLYYRFVLQDCTCDDTVNKNGNGICQMHDRKFGDLLSCVVNQPSSCKDLLNSTTNLKDQLSAQACTDINQGNAL